MKERRETQQFLSWFLPQSGSTPVPLYLTREFTIITQDYNLLTHTSMRLLCSNTQVRDFLCSRTHSRRLLFAQAHSKRLPLLQNTQQETSICSSTQQETSNSM